MENFQPLVRHLHAADGALLAETENEISVAIRRALDPTVASPLTESAARVLASHEGATHRHLKVLHPTPKPA